MRWVKRGGSSTTRRINPTQQDKSEVAQMQGGGGLAMDCAEAERRVDGGGAEER